MPRYTFQAGAHWPYSLIDLTNYKDADNTVGPIIAQIKAYQEAGDYEAAQAIIIQHVDTLKQYVYDASEINKYIEELRNLEIYTKSKKQQIFYEETEDSFANYAVLQDVWLGNKSDVAGIVNQGNVTDSQVLAGATFMASDGTLHTGTMPDNGAITAEIKVGQEIAIPFGYHNGSGVIKAIGNSPSSGAQDLGTIRSNGLQQYGDITSSSVFFHVSVPTVMTATVDVVKGENEIKNLARPIEHFVIINGYTNTNNTDIAYASTILSAKGTWQKNCSAGTKYGITSVSGNSFVIKWSTATKFTYFAW